jgi:hypothetical protein
MSTSQKLRRHTLQQRIGRRELLLGAGGLAVGLPLMSSLAGKARAAEGDAPKRLVLMYTPNGVMMDVWKPLNVVSETSFDLNATHASLAAHKSRLMFFNGVDLTIADNSAFPGGLHQRGIGSLFTNSELQSGSDFVDGCGQRSGWANGISIDQEVVKTIGQDTLLPSLELGVHALDNDVQGRIAYAGPARPLPPMNDPTAVFDRLFSTLGTKAGTEMEQLRLRRKSVLDVVQDQFTAVNGRLGSDDKAKLDAHLTLVRDVERRLTDGGTPNDCEAPERPSLIDATSEADIPRIADLEIDLLALAFACDLTRVASIQFSTALNRVRYPWINATGEGHLLSHSGVSDSVARVQLEARDAFHASRLARFLDKLSQIPEGNGTALDNTLVLWGNEVAVGATHAHTDMPLLMVGGGWHFRTGRALTYQRASHANLLVSVLNAMGVPATTFGHPDYCSGALSGLV